MASIINRPNGHKWIQFTFAGNRKTVRLGEASLRVAEEVARRISAILAAKRSEVSLDAETSAWLGKIDSVLHGRLAAAGLIDARHSARLGDFLDNYISHLMRVSRSAGAFDEPQRDWACDGFSWSAGFGEPSRK